LFVLSPAMGFIDLSSDAGLRAFDNYIASKRYIQGYMPTSLDADAIALLKKAPSASFPHAARYFATVSKMDLSSARQGGAVPAELAGSVASPAPAQAPPRRSKVTPEAQAPAPAAGNADVAALEKAVADQGDRIRQLKSADPKPDKAALQPEIDTLLKLKAELAAAKGEPADGGKKKGKGKGKGGGGGGKGGGGGGEGGKKKGKGKKDKAPKEKSPEELAKEKEKLEKAVKKEGGKTGQDIIGVHEMGGLEFFCTSIITPNGDIELCKMCLEAMNKEVDENSEEKRGGAAPVGKMLFSAGDTQLTVIAKVPEDKKAKIHVGDWMKHVMTQIKGEVVEGTDDFAIGVVKANKEKGIFPLKIKDDGINFAVMYLREKGCFPEDDDDDDDECFGDDDFDDCM